MSIDTIISILGFGLSIGAFLPLFFFKDRRREIAVIALISVITVFAAWQMYDNYKYDKELSYVKRTLLEELANSNLTYEDMQQHLGDVTSIMLSDAVREMLRSGKISAPVVRLYDQTGQTFDVRLYGVERIGNSS